MSRTLAILIALALAAAGAARGQAPPGDAALLVLRNGNLLHGRVVRSGDYYAVELKGGGSMRVPAAQVDLACRDLADAYRSKAAQLRDASPQTRLDLAEWCLRHGLAAQASEQVLAAARVDPAHPRVQLLERKLLALAEKAAAAPEPAAAPPRAGNEPAAEDREPAISPGAMAAFTANIQPLLVNRCGTTTCHGGTGSGGFQITRSPFGPAASQRLTRRNLAAVLALVRQDAPEQSKLLTVPRAAHGSVKGPVFGDRDAHQWQDLVNWTALVAANESGSAPSATAVRRPTVEPPESPFSVQGTPLKTERGAALKPANPGGPPAGIEATRPPWLANPSGPMPSLAPPVGAPAELKPMPGQRPTLSPAQPRDTDTKDPFDPESFNRLPAEPDEK